MLKRFSLGDFPIPTILCECGQIADTADAAATLTLAQAAALKATTVCIEANQSALDLVGARLTEDYNVRNRIFRSEFLEWFHETIVQLLREDQTDWRETSIYTLAGLQLPVMSRAQAFRNSDGKLTHFIWSFIDIARLKQAEAEALAARDAAEQASQSKSNFLAVMSHEIRTPLNGVLGMAQLLLRQRLPDDQREMVSIVNQSGEALLAILGDLLDLAKIEAGRLELETTQFDIEDLAKGAHNAFTAIAQKKGLSFDLAIDIDARGTYVGDPTRLRQILYNLVSNALKFTEAGEVRVKVDRLDGKLVLAVRDTGIGVSADQATRLFQRFTQADASTTRKYGGTGLGLSICQELALLMGGAITVQSTEGHGSEFTLKVPMEWLGADRYVAEGVLNDQDPPTFEAAGIRVLAADDNTVNQLVLRAMLLAAGLDVTIVGDGVLALEAMEDQSFDVVLMDIQMPEMDGVSAVKEIRRRERASDRPRTPVIALTANAMTHQVASYLSAGMDDHVEKPIQMGKLMSALTRALEAEEALECKAV